MKTNTLVKHIPTGDILKVNSTTKVFLRGYKHDTKYDITDYIEVKVRVSECEVYIAPPKEKSFYDKMREKNMEDALKLSKVPTNVDQHILWLKMAVIDRVERVEEVTSDKVCTFRDTKLDKFGFTEEYVNILMHYAYEAGRKNATDSLTRTFTQQTNSMKHAIDAIVNALDTNDLLSYEENY